MTCLFITALFADAANIPDLFAGKTLIVAHGDEDASTAACSTRHSSSDSFSSGAQTILDASIVERALRVAYDVDSPSLQGGEFHHSGVIRLHFTDCAAELSSPFVAEALYLRNSSFLI